MQEQDNANPGANESDPNVIRSIVEACVDQQIQDAIKKYDESKKKKWRNSWRSASPITKGSFILTAFIAGATIAYAVTAWYTLGAMREISRESGAQTQKLLEAANQMKDAAWEFKGSAQAIDGNLGNAVAKLQGQVDQMQRYADDADATVGTAQDSVKVARDATYLELRPWVGVRVVPVSCPNAANTNCQALVPVAHNSGKTPALHWKPTCFGKTDTEAKAELGCAEAGRLNGLDIESIMNTIPWQGKTVVPDGDAEFGGLMTSAKTGDQRFTNEYVLGVFTYHDALRSEVEHFTNYCVWRHGNGDWQLCNFGQDMN